MPTFNPQTFLKQLDNGKMTLKCPKKQTLFSQGDTADAVFYIQAGKVKLTVISPQGKKAVIVILEPGSFFGEGCRPHRQTVDAPIAPRRPHLLRAVPCLYAGSERSHPRGLGGSTL
jgi:hypothetical protein